MCMHIQRIDGQIIRRQVEGFKHLLKGKIFAVTVNDYLLYALASEHVSLKVHNQDTHMRSSSQLRLDEP